VALAGLTACGVAVGLADGRVVGGTEPVAVARAGATVASPDPPFGPID
jgi:hypothetical protein